RNAGAGWTSLARLISAAHTGRRHFPTPRSPTPRSPGSPRPGTQQPLTPRHGTAYRTATLSPDRPSAFLLGDDGPTGTVLLGPGSDVGRAVTAGDHGRAHALLTAWQRRLPGAIAIEVVCHLTRPGTSRSLTHAARMLEL